MLKRLTFRTFKRHCVSRHHFNNENLDYCNLRADVDPICKKSRDCRKWRHLKASDKSNVKQISFYTFRKCCRERQHIEDIGLPQNICHKRYGIPHPVGEGFYDHRCMYARDCYLWQRLTPKGHKGTILSKILCTQQSPKIRCPWE